MTKKALMWLVLIGLLVCPAAMAQTDDKPTIAWLKWGDSRNVALAEKAILDMLEVYGFINSEERALLDDEHSIEGERVNIIYGDSLFDRLEANVLIEEALDKDADIFITFTTQMTQIVYYSIREFVDPPKLIFTVTSGPYITGVADSSCVKPDFVIGTVPVTDYRDIVPLLRMQNPDMQAAGAIWSPQQRASEVGVSRIKAIAQSLDPPLTIVDETIVVTPDLYQAVQNLADQGAEAIIIPIFTFQGFSLLLSLTYDYGLPVVFSAPQNAYRGGTIGGGFFGLYKQGVIAGNMLVGHLNGDYDIATTSIYESNDFAYAVNLDAADLQGVDIPQAMLDGAAYVVSNGETEQGVTLQWPELEIALPDMPLEERRAADLAFLAGLECTPEMIAEQQAALNAAP
ncbi:MAG: ABC transporter substrate binding protein [Chloroflexota bacterium]|nr:ABC transporter substrate binding protein [Chloroflexota bacterium]